MSVFGALEFTSGAIATLLSVITLVLTGRHLKPVNVFMLLSFNNVLRLSISFYVALGLLQIAEAYSSLKRIKNFLLLENLPIKGWCKTTEQSNKHSKLTESTRKNNKNEDFQEKAFTANTLFADPETIVCLTNLTCKQDNRDNFILQNVELHAIASSLTVITGSVGSGKSTLLSAIAGEVSDTSGNISCLGSLVYLPQIAWVFSGTIRENILFGQPYDEKRYNRITEACALSEDIQLLPDGDQTIVGESGAVLSGGQRARVSLARAVYADADVYLLDDPLSAVDVKVGHYIFTHCITGLLGHKTRVLTSHQEQHMKKADNVIVLYQGCVLGKGSFSELQGKGILSTTVDPLFKKSLTEVDEKLVEDGKDALLPDISASNGTSDSQAKSLVMPPEDRAIGAVSSKLYWDYFKSGIHFLVILAGTSFCFFTQGWSLFVESLSLFKLLEQNQEGNKEGKKEGRRKEEGGRNVPLLSLSLPSFS